MEQKRRWDGLSVLKLLSCVVVILLHCPLPGLLGDAVIYGLRFSVPCFLMISGYFAWGRSADWIKRTLLKTIRTTLTLEALYAVWQYIRAAVIFRTPLPPLLWLNDLGPLAVLRKLLFGTFAEGTLWYMYALVYTYLILLMLVRRGMVGRCYWMIVPLLAVQIFGRFALQNSGSFERYLDLFRSAILFGLPFMLLGHWCHENEERLLARMTLGRCAALAVGAGGLMVAEYLLSGRYMDLHVSSVVLSMALMLGALNLPVLPRALQPAVYAGRQLSGRVYFVHIFVMTLTAMLLPWVEGTILHPALTVALSFALAWAMTSAAAALRRKKR